MVNIGDRSGVRLGTALATPSRPRRFAARASRTNCIADSRSVLRCSGVVHPLRIQLHVDPARSTGTEHCRHRDRRHFGGRHAATGPSETACCPPDWQRCDARRFKTGRLLQLPFRDPPGWPAVECVVRLVVDGSGCRTGDGSGHREGRHRRTPGRSLLRPLRAAIVWSALPTSHVGGLECTLNAQHEDFGDHWRALRNGNTSLSSAPRHSGKRSWTNCIISRR